MLISSPDMAPSEQGIYSQISVARVDCLGFTAGQLGRDQNRGLAGKGDCRVQGVQCFKNIASALVALGADPRPIVRITLNVVNPDENTVGVIFEAGTEVFGGRFPACAKTY